MANPHWVQPDHILTMTGAPDPLLTLAEAKAQLEYEDTDKDAYLTALIQAATDLLDGPDGMAGKAIAEQVWTYSLRTVSGDVALPVFPVKSLESVSYYDIDNVAQDFDLSNVRLVANEDWAYVEILTAWPALYDRADAITFTLQLGLAEVPEAFKHAARLMVAHWFENREAASDKSIRGIEFAVDALVNRYRTGWIGA